MPVENICLILTHQNKVGSNINKIVVSKLYRHIQKILTVLNGIRTIKVGNEFYFWRFSNNYNWTIKYKL